jgi:hypothetical protein
MASMLEEAKKLAFSRKIDFICLMPGEKSLFDFYSKFGYKTVFSKKILKIDVPTDIDTDISESIDIKDLELISQLQNEKMKVTNEILKLSRLQELKK